MANTARRRRWASPARGGHGTEGGAAAREPGRRVYWRGIGEALGVMLCFVGFGLAWAAAESRAPGVAAPYPARMGAPTSEEPATWLVDGFNLLHAGLLGGRDRAEWWTAPRRCEVMERVRRFEDPAAEVWVVFDGPRPAEPEPAADPPTGARQVFAPSADDWLLARVRAAADPGRVAVVTGDRRLANRARHRGARVWSPREFLARCAEAAGGSA